jgi:hypothetical protein
VYLQIPYFQPIGSQHRIGSHSCCLLNLDACQGATYQSTDCVVEVPALSNSMPHLSLATTQLDVQWVTRCVLGAAIMPGKAYTCGLHW